MAAPAHTDTAAFLKEVFAGEPWDRASPVRAYQTGAERWTDLPTWPPPTTAPQDWFLHPGGDLSTEDAPTGRTTYTYDPANPTPALGGPSLLPDSGPVDNATHEQRPDVVTFRSAVLEEPLDIAGEPTAHIRIRSTAPSFDVFARITDLHPDGRSMTVCDGIRRTSSPTPDGGFHEVTVPLWPTFHRFARGHRIGVQLSSGAHPRYARNPGTGAPAATAETTVVAHQEIDHSASRVTLPAWQQPD